MQDNEPYIMGKRRKIYQLRWGRVLFALFLVSVLVCLSVVFLARGSKRLAIKEHSYFFVTLGAFTSANQCSQLVADTVNGGGAGFVLFKDKAYYVSAMMYPSIAEATSVQQRLTQQGKKAEVVSLSHRAQKWDLPKGKDEREYLNSMDSVFETLSSLYQLSIRLDKGEMTEAAAQSAVKTFVSMFLNQPFLSYDTQNMHETDAKIRQLIQAVYLPLTTELTQKENFYKVQLKYALCSAAFNVTQVLN